MCNNCRRYKVQVNYQDKRGKSINKNIVSKTLSTIAVLIFKTLIDLYIIYEEFFSVNNVLRDYEEMKEGIKNSENAVEYTT